mmetsp:Transcript_41976/g.64273  ORF Transcript_41976/g.64273 Transcript_41976/m.64273 type:complete len:121 (-) Transcript_41976:17-379(-)
MHALEDIGMPQMQDMLLGPREEFAQCVEICDHVFSFSGISLEQGAASCSKTWQKTLVRQYCEICDSEFAMALMASEQGGDQEFTLICEKCYHDYCDEGSGLQFVKYLGTTNSQFFSSRFR